LRRGGDPPSEYRDRGALPVGLKASKNEKPEFELLDAGADFSRAPKSDHIISSTVSWRLQNRL
jgi:hypothetical protein